MTIVFIDLDREQAIRSQKKVPVEGLTVENSSNVVNDDNRVYAYDEVKTV